jgi:hypothetical protein
MRVFARRERPHPGAQLSLFEAAGGWGYSLWVINLPERTTGWRSQLAHIDATHRVHARVEGYRTGKNTRIGKLPSHAFALNQAWLAAAVIAAALLAWLRLLALDGSLARAEPKTLRHRLLHAAGRLTRSRRRHLKIAATWPWATRWCPPRTAPLPCPGALTSDNTISATNKEPNPGASGTPATRPASRAAVVPRP